VPVPDPGVPREWVDAAREAIRENRRPSSAGRRFWELSGGILRCGGCGCAMMTNSISSHGKSVSTIIIAAPSACETRPLVPSRGTGGPTGRSRGCGSWSPAS
jgi:hypothetical protein